VEEKILGEDEINKGQRGEGGNSGWCAHPRRTRKGESGFFWTSKKIGQDVDLPRSQPFRTANWTGETKKKERRTEVNPRGGKMRRRGDTQARIPCVREILPSRKEREIHTQEISLPVGRVPRITPKRSPEGHKSGTVGKKRGKLN